VSYRQCLPLHRREVRGWYFFFFQAEDGIRARNVTGVQTCALPISSRFAYPSSQYSCSFPSFKISRFAPGISWLSTALLIVSRIRSEERRVGKESRSRTSPAQ